MANVKVWSDMVVPFSQVGVSKSARRAVVRRIRGITEAKRTLGTRVSGIPRRRRATALRSVEPFRRSPDRRNRVTRIGRALASGPLWLLPPGPDQVRNMAPPRPIRDTQNNNRSSIKEAQNPVEPQPSEATKSTQSRPSRSPSRPQESFALRCRAVASRRLSS